MIAVGTDRWAIPLRLSSEPGNEARAGEPVTCGVPFARGLLGASASLALWTDERVRLPLQTHVLDQWSDGSARWVLLDFAIPTDGTAALLLGPDGDRPGIDDVLARHVGGTIRVRAGHVEFDVPGTTGLLRFGDDQPRESVMLRVTGADGRSRFPRWDGCTIETAGALRSTVRCTGVVDVAGRSLSVSARISVFRSTPAVRIELTLHNPSGARHRQNFWELGDAGSVLLRDVSVWLSGVDDDETLHVSIDRASDAQPALFPLSIHQESSGGEHWNGNVHRDAQGRVPIRFNGYTMNTRWRVRTGRRADPVVTLTSSQMPVSLYVDEFWQKFPSRIQASAATGLTVSFLAVDGGPPAELQGGESATRILTVCFGSDAKSLTWARTPTLARTDPEHYCSSGVLPFLECSGDPRHTAILEDALTGESSFAAKRERVDEFGWRNFGDVYADHEAVGQGHETVLVSHYNNQYDAIAGFARQFLRSGDRRWWQLFDELARHVRDVDIYQTTDDKAAYAGGLFWHTFHYKDAGLSTHRSYPRSPGVYGGGPSAEHNYNLGLALHFFLTGAHASRQAAMALADWVIRMDDGRRTVFRWLDGGATGWASATGMLTYQGPGRGAGNSIGALLVAAQLSGERRYVEKAEELIRRCIHPDDDRAALDLLNPEPRWSYTVFLQWLARYVAFKAERGDLDGMYSYARESLLAYARWMSDHEYPYLDKPELLEYPNETWAAQDLRKAEIFVSASLVAWGPEQDRFLERARFFYDAALDTLTQSPTRLLARPVVILLSFAGSLPWLRSHPESSMPEGVPERTLTARRCFQPQRTRAIRRAKILAVLGASLFALVIAAVAGWWF
jgi:hypothetical protein